MIDRLTGQVADAGTTWAVVEIGGFGVRVLCPPATAARLRPGAPATVFTTLVVREDSLTLFGFSSPAERDAFELVQTASGVGPKLALAVVSVLSPAELVEVVSTEQVKRLTAVPGIGTKGAQKIIIELKDKVAALGAGVGAAQAPPAQPAAEAWREQVAAGLVGLGWSAKDAELACDRVAPLREQDPGASVAALMRAALQTLAR